ncbi:hypothetical protein LFR94_000340 [Vibrio vulnificus]|uniref:hypothetical protein n=1 Tax=Vibrio vulnificus TaxID=672 RepID=UPI0021D9C47A|nr:hypothetical protein [Vibrio vulnificus]EIF2687170.1 hypothetical protein [Vibrio vulnificus]EJR4266012.1 hypothetical protein [Vibrio vulnificus]EJU9869284.1 hypothetical protein [Vibrio vulnificus]EKZ9232131.1 hypothetical protein [Vibrio vulnificus]
MRGSIHPHAPDAAFGNTLTATDNNESEASSNTDNEVLKPSHGARYTMGPRVREDDGVRELIRTTSCHSRAYGNPFIHTRQNPSIGNALTATDNDESETNNAANEVPKPSHGARYTMDPRVREDDGVRELNRTTSCHSRAYGNPFIHTRQKPSIGNALTITDKN